MECDPTEPSQHLTACSLLALTFARSYWTIRVSGHLVRCPRQDIGLREESERTRTAPPPFQYNFSSPKVIASEQASERAHFLFCGRYRRPPSKSPFLGPAFRPHLPPSLSHFHPSIYAGGGDHKCGGRFGQFSPYAARAVTTPLRSPDQKERGKTRNIIIPLGTLPKRGKGEGVQARTNSCECK